MSGTETAPKFYYRIAILDENMVAPLVTPWYHYEVDARKPNTILVWDEPWEKGLYSYSLRSVLGIEKVEIKI